MTLIFDQMSPFQLSAIALAAVAAVWDLRVRRIPNVLTFGAAAAAIVAHGVVSGPTGAGWAIAGLLVGLVFFFPLFALGGMGAGDVKLVAALGACLGPASAAWLALFSFIAGGILGLAVAVGYGYLTQLVTNLSWMFQFWRREGPRPVPSVTLATHRGPRLAYAVPVFAGLMVTLWLK